MRQVITGFGLPGSTVSVFVAGTTVPASVYTSMDSVETVNVIVLDNSGLGKFYYDDITYPFPAYFDLVLSKSGYESITLQGIWSGFVSNHQGVLISGSSPYTLLDMRSRLATFYSLNKDNPQVKAVLDECIQTGYEKVISMINQHARQRELTITSVTNKFDYDVVGLGIPTYVGYKTSRLDYLPYEVLREKYNNFGTDWDSGSSEPVNYSLVGYDGERKRLIIAPSPKVSGNNIFILCFQNPGILSKDTDYPLIPQDWCWLVLERAKVERLRFEGDIESYQVQAQEFVAYVKVMIKRLYPASPEPESGFRLAPEREAYNAWRGRRQQ